MLQKAYFIVVLAFAAFMFHQASQSMGLAAVAHGQHAQQLMLVDSSTDNAR